MRSLILAGTLLLASPALAITYCPSPLVVDPLERCVCPTGRLTDWEKVTTGGEDACIALPFLDPEARSRGGTVALLSIPDGKGGFTVVSVPTGGDGGSGGGIINPTDGGGGGGTPGTHGCGHGGGGNCGVGLGNGGGNGTGNEGNGQGPKGGPKHDGQPSH